MKKNSETGPSGLDLVESAFRLVRNALPMVWATYYIGALPFIAGLITFWATMMQSAFAAPQLPGWALLLGVLFIWMKTWQARYGRMMYAQAAGRPELPAWGLGDFWRTATLQGPFHASGIILIPLAMVSVVLFPSVYGMYQTAHAVHNSETDSARELGRRSFRIGRFRSRQHYVMLWMIGHFPLLLVGLLFFVVQPGLQSMVSEELGIFGLVLAALSAAVLIPLAPFALLLAINTAIGLMTLGSLFKTFTGIDTVFTTASNAAMNSTYLVMVFGIVYLLIDPVLKAAYAIRCFEAESLQTGEDLRVAIRRSGQGTARTAWLGVLGFLGSGVAYAAETTRINPERLQQSVSEELNDPRYSWRIPRESGLGLEDEAPGLFAPIRDFFQTIGEWLKAGWKRVENFLEWLFGDGGGSAPEFGVPSLMTVDTMLTLLIVVLVGLLLVLLLQFWRSWSPGRRDDVEGLDREAVLEPDLEDESTAADALPDEGWLALARELLGKGERRLAMRALFFAILAQLSERQLIQIARYKSNREYLRELRRFAHVHPELPPKFTESMRVYESVWYGDHPASEDRVATLMQAQEQFSIREQE